MDGFQMESDLYKKILELLGQRMEQEVLNYIYRQTFRKSGEFVNYWVYLLQEICYHNLHSLLEEVLKIEGVDINLKDGAIHIATIYDASDCLEKLLSSGADLNLTDFNEKTALHWALMKGRLDLISNLVSKKANCQALDAKGKAAADVSLNSMVRDHYLAQCKANGVEFAATREWLQ